MELDKHSISAGKSREYFTWPRHKILTGNIIIYRHTNPDVNSEKVLTLLVELSLIDDLIPMLTWTS